MKYIFEDKKGCVLDQVFKIAYNEIEYNNIIFTNNNSNAVKTAEREVLKGELVVVYLDMVPGNENIIRLYNKLKEISEENNNKLLVIPIYCSEYLLIKAFKDLNIFKNRDNIELCLNKYNYLDSKLYYSQQTYNDYKTFEKYCKLILERDCIMCASSRSRYKIENYKYIKNKVHNMFYTSECLYSLNNLHRISRIDKVISILKSLPIMPKGNKFIKTYTNSWKESWSLHEKLIKDFNEFVMNVRNIEHLKDECKIVEPIKLKDKV